MNARPLANLKSTFIQLALPDDVINATSIEDAEAALRPYLLGEKIIKSGDEEISLFAAILIPEGYSADREGPKAQYWSRNLTDLALEGAVSRAPR